MGEIIQYKNLDWYVMNETDTEKLLLLKECFTREQALKYFNPEIVGTLSGVMFNSDSKKIWWEESTIREGLNGPFLSDLDKEDLNIMRTTLTLKVRSRTTEDYVRLIRVEEVKHLREINQEILRTKKDWYWAMDPYYFGSSSRAYVFAVCGSGDPGYLGNWSVNNAGPGVRPVVSLKSDNLTSKKVDEEQLRKTLIEMIWRLNNKVDVNTWKKYNKRFDSLIKINASKEIIMLLDILGNTLFKTAPILERCSEDIIPLMDNLNHTKKLLKI